MAAQAGLGPSELGNLSIFHLLEIAVLMESVVNLVPEFLMVTVPLTSLAQAGSPFCPHRLQLSSGFLDRICPNSGSFPAQGLVPNQQKPSQLSSRCPLSWTLLTLSSPCSGLLGWSQQRGPKQVNIPQTNISHPLCPPCMGVKTKSGLFCLNFVDLRYCSTTPTSFSVEKALSFYPFL